MDSVLRTVGLYVFLVVLFRVAGRRTLSEMTNFDFVLLLIISEATQQGMLGDDYSITNALLVIVTLVFLDILLSLAKQRVPRLERVLEGGPTVIVVDGRPREELMRRERIGVDDVLQAARRLQGLERLDQIKYAILESSGGITIIPRTDARG